MNTAVFMLSACLVGAEPAPANAHAGVPVVVATSSGCTGGCGTATTTSIGDCDPCAQGHKHGLLAKLKAKLCNPCGGHEIIKHEPVIAKPACVKHTPICKVETPCDPCAKVCWKPGMLLHKIKDKFSNLCHKDGCAEPVSVCAGGCGTAATPGGCGSTVIPPTTSTPAPSVISPGPTPMPIPMTTPLPTPKPPVMPEPKAQPKTTPKVVTMPASPYGPNLSAKPTLAPVVVPSAPEIAAPRTLDIGPAPF